MTNNGVTFTYKVTKEISSYVISDREFDAIVELFRYIESNGNEEQMNIMDDQIVWYKRHALYVFSHHNSFLYSLPVYNLYKLADTSDALIPYVANIMVAAVTTLKYKDQYKDSGLINVDFPLDEEFDTTVHQILDLLESKEVFDWKGFYKVCRYLFNEENIMFSSFFKYYIESIRHTNKSINNILNLVYDEDKSFTKSNSECEEIRDVG